MIWFYQRSGEHIEAEIKKAVDDSGYELALTRPDGATVVEWFENEQALLARSRGIEQELGRNGWRGPHGRDM